jgi:ATP-dependent helicase HrpB
MLVFAARRGAAREAARLALLLQERGLGGKGEDLARRLDRWNGERGGRAEASRKLAARWAEMAGASLRPPARTCRWTRASSAPGRASRGSLPRSHRPPPVRQRGGMAVLRGRGYRLDPHRRSPPPNGW